MSAVSQGLREKFTVLRRLHLAGGEREFRVLDFAATADVPDTEIVGRIAKDRGCPAPFISLAKLPDFRASPHSNRCFPSCHKSPLRLTTLLGIVGNTSSGAGGEVAISAMSRSISATSNPVSVTSNPWAGSSSISSPGSTARSSRSHPACSAMRLSAISYSAKNSVGRKFFRILPSSLKRRRMPPVGQKARAPSPKRLYPSGPLLLDPIIACIETKLMRKGLAYAVHLVVGLSLRKRQQFSFKSGQKVCPHGKRHITAFKFCLVDVELADFIAFDGNKPHRSVEF